MVGDRKLCHIPKGWEIYRTELVTPPKGGRPRFMILLMKEIATKAKGIGFKVNGKRR